MRCKHYQPYCVTYRAGYGQHEINDACVNEDKRTIRQCDHTRCQESCPEFEDERR